MTKIHSSLGRRDPVLSAPSPRSDVRAARLPSHTLSGREGWSGNTGVVGERQPLKLRPDPGEYRCTWTLVDDGGGVTEMPGDLELREDDAPRGYMYGDQIPVEWQGEEQRAASFPQRRHYARVVGKLINGHEAVLIETDLLIWAPDRAILHPRAALVGDHIPSHTSPRFVSIKVQITGLDIMAGIGPLKAFSFPTG